MRRYQNRAAATRASPTTPPTTPPAIAPVFDLEEELAVEEELGLDTLEVEDVGALEEVTCVAPVSSGESR